MLQLLYAILSGTEIRDLRGVHVSIAKAPLMDWVGASGCHTTVEARPDRPGLTHNIFLLADFVTKRYNRCSSSGSGLHGKLN